MSKQYSKNYMNSYDKMDILINKIFRFLPSNDKNRIKHMTKSSYNNDHEKANAISNFVTKYVSKYGIKPNENRQEFIIGKLTSYLETNCPELLHDGSSIVDMGGGNGDVLSGLRNSVPNTNIEDFICIETLSDWNETYKFDNTNITYKFWNTDDETSTIDLPNNSVDIVICMVSLHHMTDDTISTVLSNIHSALKPNGRILIKEHNRTNESINYILWEHVLYHIMDCAYNNKIIDTPHYFESVIYNFKSKEQWNNAFKAFGFELVDIKNRFLDGNYVLDNKNPTELYWAIYKKKN